MRTVTIVDPKNTFPNAELHWDGVGWYAGYHAGDTCVIDKVGDHPHRLPDMPAGYGTPIWASDVVTALGNYGKK